MSFEDYELKASFGKGKLLMESAGINKFNQGLFELTVDHDDNIDVFQIETLLLLKIFDEDNSRKYKELEKKSNMSARRVIPLNNGL